MLEEVLSGGEAPEGAISAKITTFLETGLLCYYETNSRQQQRWLMKTNPQTHPLGSALVENIILGKVQIYVALSKSLKSISFYRIHLQ